MYEGKRVRALLDIVHRSVATMSAQVEQRI